MQNSSNRQIDITGDIIHTLAIEFNVTLKEVNKQVGDDVYNIVGKCVKEFI